LTALRALAAAQASLDDREVIGAVTFVMGLRARGIRDTAVLAAMERVPRELFAPNRFADLARADVALPLPCGQTMTAPGTVAAMMVALDVREGHRVLEIGTGSGYVTALLARLGARVLSVERYATLASSAAARIRTLGCEHAAVRVADGLCLDLGRTRFDRILVNGVARALPGSVTAHLAAGGRLVGALVTDGPPRMVCAWRDEEGRLRHELGAVVRLSPLGNGRAEAL
jgi:protein-L-isoaspartate(D-aspartate) O-methyltransferase